MTADIEIVFLKKGDPRLSEVEGLFQQMYEYQETKGLLLPLAPNGAAKWLHSIAGSLGRLGCLIVAMKEEQVIGFLHASLQIVPEFLGGGLVGRITHVFVNPAVRRNGLGRQLVDVAVTWLKSKGASSVELQVLAHNETALAFWQSLGFVLELHQMRMSLA